MRSTAVCLLLAGGALSAHADEASASLKLTALGAAPVDGGAGHSERLTLEPGWQWRGADLSLRGSVRLRQLRLEDQRRTDLDLRELSLSWRGQTTQLSLGAQQLNWGRMDLLRVTDQINASDQQDLFLEEQPEAKRALWLANLEWQRDAHSLQLLATPQVPVDRLPARIGGLPVELQRPRTGLRNGSLALRYGLQGQDWNTDLIALHGWQTQPSLQPGVVDGRVVLSGSVRRQDSLGFSADRPWGAWVLRLEGLLARLPATASLPRQRQAVLGLGLDRQQGPWFLAGQAVHWQTQSAGAARQPAQWLSLLVQRKWLQDRVATRVLHLRETRSDSSWSSAQASYELSAHQVVQMQWDRFRGQPGSALGLFTGRSRLALSLRQTF